MPVIERSVAPAPGFEGILKEIKTKREEQRVRETQERFSGIIALVAAAKTGFTISTERVGGEVDNLGFCDDPTLMRANIPHGDHPFDELFNRRPRIEGSGATQEVASVALVAAVTY
jgi:hypothetical protein